MKTEFTKERKCKGHGNIMIKNRTRLCLFIMTAAFCLGGCGLFHKHENIDAGMEAVAALDYDGAIASFDLALDAGNILSLNMVLLGAVTADDKFPLSKDSVINAMKNNLHERFHDLNIKAIENGYQSIKG